MPIHQHILVVEDDQTVRELTVDALQVLGYQASGAANAEQALALIEANPTINLMITDLGLPGMSGQELAKQVKQYSPSMHIVIASGYIQNHRLVGEHGNQAVNDTFHLIGKPFTLEQLKSTIEKVYGFASSPATSL